MTCFYLACSYTVNHSNTGMNLLLKWCYYCPYEYLLSVDTLYHRNVHICCPGKNLQLQLYLHISRSIFSILFFLVKGLKRVTANTFETRLFKKTFQLNLKDIIMKLCGSDLAVNKFKRTTKSMHLI